MRFAKPTLAAGLVALLAASCFAASHRNGPLLLEDQTANLNDMYFFRSPEAPDKAVLIMSAQGFQNPGNGPSYYKFSDSVVYGFNINNARGLDGNADLQIQFAFSTRIRNTNTILSYGSTLAPITSIDSDGINLYQTYGVVVRHSNGKTDYFNTDVNGHPLSVAPPNIGPKTTPNYEQNLGATSVFTLANGMRVFAGPRDDGFYFDSAATFDLLNFHAPAPVLPGPYDASQGDPYPKQFDHFAGYNISAIAVEVPIAMLTANSQVPTDPKDPNATVGAWATTQRQLVEVRPSPDKPVYFGDYVQIDRVGNPLTVEVFIPVAMKDYWNRSAPANDAQFAPFFANPELVAVLKAVYGLNVPAAPRMDLLGVFAPDLQRLNLAVPPSASPSRLGPLAGDNAGWPNGRRVGDDVVDVGLRALAGVLVPGFNIAPNNQLGDGVNSNDVPYLNRFPFLGTPHAGYDHTQRDGTNGRGGYPGGQ
ncbi:MAG TPA: DUF4331 domain-containing protein [Bryobacterales bacterium]|nr:DUF4331 domain-containing protein [Bryobacterales bacterium]